MTKMSPIKTFPIALHIKAARIPVTWTIRESRTDDLLDASGKVLRKAKTERVFWPQVERTKWNDVELQEIENPLDLRAEMFRMVTSITEEAALKILRSIGAWSVEKGDPALRSSFPERYADIAFGHRFILNAHIREVTLDEMREDIKRWYRLMKAPASQQKKHFMPPPPPDTRNHERSLFALEAGATNTLPVSLEWRGKFPEASVETLSAWELANAVTWADVMRGAEVQVCANENCATSFTDPRKKKHCSYACAHKAAQREYKRRAADKKRKALLERKSRKGK
jgi:hypothetical protein